jgi:uroporphyrinogen-III synthase
MHLDGLRVLITRPAGRADDLLRAIAAAGGNPTHVALLTVSPLDAQNDAAVWQHTEYCIRRLPHYQRIIAISVNAVHHGMAWIAAAWPSQTDAPHALQLPPHLAWYGIGAATIAEFARTGIAARGGSAGATSEALLALPELRAVRGEAILILRGIGGRETLAGVLRERGASIDYAECYRRSAPQLDSGEQQLLLSAAFDAVCVNSAETLQNLWHYLQLITLQSVALQPTNTSMALQSQYQRMALIVPSERVAALAAKLGFLSIVTAANAGTAATLTALHDIIEQSAAN